METSFGTEIRKRRKAKGLTQHQVAMKAGMAANHLGLIETGKIRKPRQKLARRIARALDIPYERLDSISSPAA